MRLRANRIAAVVVWMLATISPFGASAQPREDASQDVTEPSREELLSVEVMARVPRTLLGSVTWRY